MPGYPCNNSTETQALLHLLHVLTILKTEKSKTYFGTQRHFPGQVLSAMDQCINSQTLLCRKTFSSFMCRLFV